MPAIPAVDHRLDQRAGIDFGARSRTPGRTHMRFEETRCRVTEELESVAALGHVGAPEFDGADLRAVLLLLTALLVILVAVELALNPVAGAMEKVRRRPRQILEIGFEAGVAERRNEASKMSASAPRIAFSSGRGRGSGSS